MTSAINRKSIGVNAGITFKLVEISTSIEAMSHTLNCNGRLVKIKIFFLLSFGLLFLVKIRKSMIPWLLREFNLKDIIKSLVSTLIVYKLRICAVQKGPYMLAYFCPPPYTKINYVNTQDNYVYMPDNYVDMEVTNIFRWSDFYIGKLTYICTNTRLWR